MYHTIYQQNPQFLAYESQCQPGQPSEDLCQRGSIGMFCLRINEDESRTVAEDFEGVKV